MLAREGHDSSVPSAVLFVLHPYATDPSVLLHNYGFGRRVAGKRDWLVVVPEGTRDSTGRLSWNASAACCGTGTAGPTTCGTCGWSSKMCAAAPRSILRGSMRSANRTADSWPTAGLAPPARSCAASSASPELRRAPTIRPARPRGRSRCCKSMATVTRWCGTAAARARGRYPGARESVEMWRALDRCDPLPRTSREPGCSSSSPASGVLVVPSARVALWTAAGGGHQLRLRLWTDAMIDFLAAGR